MKRIIHLLIAVLILCSTTVATMEDLHPYTVYVIVWDEAGLREGGLPITFEYKGQSEMLYSANDGSVSFSLLNFDGVTDGSYITVSSKYGTKEVRVDYEYGAVGVTFNEPSGSAAMTAFAALGFIVVAAGGGIYYLKRKKKDGDE